MAVRLSGIFSNPASREATHESMSHDYSALPTTEPPVHSDLEWEQKAQARRHFTVADSRSLWHDANNDEEIPRRKNRQTVHIGAMNEFESQHSGEAESQVHESATELIREEYEKSMERAETAKKKEMLESSLTEAPAFQSFIGIVIAINSLLMGFEIDVPWYGWAYIEQVLLCIYVFELYIRLKHFGSFFFSWDNDDIVWNVLDFIIVTSSVLDSWVTPLCALVVHFVEGSGEGHGKGDKGMSLGKFMMLMRLLRLMRILRLAKLVKSVRPLFILVTGVMAALQGVVWVLVLTIVTLYAMGLLATSLIGKKMGFPPGTEVAEEVLKPFNSVPNSMFTLFRIMSGAASDSEQVAIDDLMDDLPSIKLGFVFFMITSSWTLLSILTAVVSENMISTTGQQEEEHRIATAEEDRVEHVKRLKLLFNTIDVTGDGCVEQQEIQDFLSDPGNALLTARHCRVPPRDVREVLQTVAWASEGSLVSLETFVEHLADVSNAVTEKSIMKLEAKLTNIDRHQSEGFLKLFHMMKTLQDSALSKPHFAPPFSNAPQNRSEAVGKEQLQEAVMLMRRLAQRTEACCTEMQEKNQAFVQSMTEAFERALPKFGMEKFSEMLGLELRRMQHELLCDIRGQELESNKVRAGGAIQGHGDEQPVGVSENRTDAADTAEKESTNGLRQTVESMLRKGPLEKPMDQKLSALTVDKFSEILERELRKTVDQGLSALRVDNFSEIMERELHMMTQALLSRFGGQSPDISHTAEADEQFFALTESPKEMRSPARASTPSRASSPCRASGVQMEILAAQLEARVLATEESTHGLQQKTEAMLKKIEGLLEKAVDPGPSALAVDKFSETFERELRMMRQQLLELLCLLGGQYPGISKVRERLQKGTALATNDSTGAIPK